EALERAVEVLAGGGGGAASRLGGEEEVPAVSGHPRPDPQLRVAVARGGVDVGDPVAQQQLEGAIGVGLADLGEGGRSEQRDGAAMTGAAERTLLDHEAPPGAAGYRTRARPGPAVRFLALRAIIGLVRRIAWLSVALVMVLVSVAFAQTTVRV